MRRRPRRCCRGSTSGIRTRIFDIEAPELEANVLLAEGDADGGTAGAADGGRRSADLPNYELTEAKIAYAMQQNDEAERVFKQLLLSHPLSPEAEEARARLTAMGAETSLTAAELRSLGDAYYNAGRYEEAAEQYRALARNMELPAAERTGFEVAAAACDLKLKLLTEREAEALPDTNDENGARRLYLLMELARNRDEPGRAAAAWWRRWSRGFPRARGWPRRSTRAATCTCC